MKYLKSIKEFSEGMIKEAVNIVPENNTEEGSPFDDKIEGDVENEEKTWEEEEE